MKKKSNKVKAKEALLIWYSHAKQRILENCKNENQSIYHLPHFEIFECVTVVVDHQICSIS